MCGAARLAAELGYDISGSDQAFYPPMGDAARALGAPLFSGYDACAQSRPADCYIVGNAISRGCPLMESVLCEKRPYISAAQWLGENVLRGRTVIAVAGTHGKTTTASLLAWMLERAGFSPGFLLGGTPQSFGVSARMGKPPFFVIEADEYDSAFFDKRPKFMHYRPSVLLLNNLEFDHADIYRNIQEIILQFHYLLRTVPANGQIIAPAADANIQAALDAGAYTPAARFGAGGEWDLRYAEGEMKVLRAGKEICAFAPPLPGAANRGNILAAAAAAHYAGADVSQTGEYLRDFRPPLRRMQQIAAARGIVIYDDFAHHPTAYKRTLEAAAEAHPDKRIVAVFEPRSNTMKAGVFADSLADSLSAAARVIAAGDYPWLAKSLSALGAKAAVCQTPQAAGELLFKEMRPGDCVLLMSNGGFGGLPQKAAAELQKKD